MGNKSTVTNNQIVRLLSLGKTATEISVKYNLSPRTIEKRLEIIRAAYQVNNTTHLVAHFLRLGIIK